MTGYLWYLVPNVWVPMSRDGGWGIQGLGNKAVGMSGNIQHSSVSGVFTCGMIGLPFEPYQCLVTGLAIMLADKRLPGVAPEVNLIECLTHTPPPSVNKAAHSGFETQRRNHKKSKTRVSVAPPKGLMSSKIVDLKTVLFPMRYSIIVRPTGVN